MNDGGAKLREWDSEFLELPWNDSSCALKFSFTVVLSFLGDGTGIWLCLTDLEALLLGLTPGVGENED